MRPYGYLVWLAGTVLALAALTVALGVFVDSYRLSGTAPVSGWTALKPRIYEQTGIAKTYSLERLAPTTLLLGNSRVEIGFDPESAQWPGGAGPVFNAAEAGTGLFTAERMLQEAIAVKPPRTVIVGLDFADFLEAPSTPDMPLPPPGPDEKRLLVDRQDRRNPDRPLQLWRDRMSATLTIDALLDSMLTLTDQDPETSVTMTAHGFNPLHEYRVYAQHSGYYGLFAQKNAVYAEQYQHYPKPDFADPSQIGSFRFLEDIIRIALTQHCRVTLFIHPYHAEYLDIIGNAGFWPSFEAWKRALVNVVEEASAAAPAGSIALLDFSGYNDISTESVPPEGDLRTSMQWYWESGHYKPTLGDLMVARFFGPGKGFGQELTPATIDAVLANIRDGRPRLAEHEGTAER
jgi:hypothetical protein